MTVVQGSSVGYFGHSAWWWGCSCQVQRKLVLWWNTYRAFILLFSLVTDQCICIPCIPRLVRSRGKASVDYMQVSHLLLMPHGVWRLGRSRGPGIGPLVVPEDHCAFPVAQGRNSRSSGNPSLIVFISVLRIKDRLPTLTTCTLPLSYILALCFGHLK